MDDPFTMLGLPRRFDLNETDLHDRFLQAAGATHPDRFADPLAQAEAAEQAAAINHAYRMLSDPESRANVLLELLGGPAKEQDKSLPPDLLMQMMEVREQLDQAVAHQDKNELERLRRWADQQRSKRLNKIADHFATSDGHSVEEEQARDIRIELNALRYVERMLEQLPT